jgi:hypothetical protein
VPAAVWRWLVEQGATSRTTLTLRDEAGPVDLTGYMARLQVRETVGSPTTLLDLSTSSGGISIDGPAGSLTLLLSDEATAALTWRHGVFDLEITSPGGDTTRLLKGEITVDPEVTR